MMNNMQNMNLGNTANQGGFSMSQGNYAISGVPKIRVVVRKRPLTRKELKNGDVDMIEVRGEQACVVKENK